jgi:hypothetical protein
MVQCSRGSNREWYSARGSIRMRSHTCQGQPNCRKKRHLGVSVKNLKYLKQRNGSIMFPVSKFSGFFRALTQVRCQFSDEQADWGHWAQSFLTTKKRNSTESSVVTHKLSRTVTKCFFLILFVTCDRF